MLCADIVAFGFTVIVTVNTVPVVHVPVVGVTLYVAVSATADALLSVPVRLLPVPDTPPLRSLASVAALHAYVVPAGITPVGLYENATAEQVDPACDDSVATGFTTTLTVNADPVHVPDAGVTLYTAVAAPAVVLLSVPVSDTSLPDAPPVKFVPDGDDHA